MCPELPIISNAPSSQSRLTRREMFQRILAGLGTVLAGPVAAQAHPMYRHLMDATTLEGAGERIATGIVQKVSRAQNDPAETNTNPRYRAIATSEPSVRGWRGLESTCVNNWGRATRTLAGQASPRTL